MRLQDLPRHLARRCLGMPALLPGGPRSSICEEARLVVAYSAGLDSTALLHIAPPAARPV